MRRFCTSFTPTAKAYRKNLSIKNGDVKPIVKDYRNRNVELDAKAQALELDWRVIGAT